MTLAAWFHDLSPFALRFGSGFGIRWYGLSYALGFVIGWAMLRWLARRGATLIPVERVGDAILYAVLGVVLGGRLGYVAFYRPDLLWTFTGDPPWWGLLALNEGGMASHGGIVGVIVAGIVISRGWRTADGRRLGACPPPHVLDVMAMLAPFGLFLGRLANFVNGELLGRIVAPPGQPAPWWAVKFPQEIAGGYPVPLDPRQTAALTSILDAYRMADETSDARAAQRILERVQQGDADLIRQLEPLVSARHPSQLYQALAEGVIVGAVLWFIARRPRNPGVVGCWFLISYGVLRILTEFWRLPDTHLKVQRVLGLSRGQWLSVAMVGAGIGLLIWVVRRAKPKLGGWAHPSPSAGA